MSEPLTYTQYLYSITNPAARQYLLDLSTALNNGQITPAQFANTVEDVSGKVVKPVYSRSGNVIAYTLNEISTVTTPNPINSNASTVNRGAISRPIETTVETGESVVTSSGVAGVGSRIATGCALVGTAAAAVATGVTLGKSLAGTFYNVNPDFWDSINMSTLNPETWSAITAGQEGFSADFVNFIFDFDPNTGESQAYMSQDAFAYFASYMQSLGVFEEGSKYIKPSSIESLNLNNPINIASNNIGTYAGITWPSYSTYISNSFGSFISSRYGVVDVYATSNVLMSANCVCSCYQTSDYTTFIMASDTNIFPTNVGCKGFTQEMIANRYDHVFSSSFTSNGASAYTYNNKTVYYISASILNSVLNNSFVSSLISANNSGNTNKVAWAMVYGEAVEDSQYEGMGNQPNATLPQNLTGNPTQDLSLLQQQYPDLFNNAINYPIVQPDGTVKNDVYVPVAMPNIDTRTDTQPATNDTTQANPQIDPSMQELIQELTNILQNPYPQPNANPDDTSSPENPTDTGDGSSPVPIVPAGSASALWKIYHPTQAQIDSFGGWLWSSNFIDQILKIFNNPMEAVIGLHKIYATPIDGGTATIKVGYLDSQVPSAYIEQQYIDVSCGSVNLNEEFGNVFDYSPFTDVQLYLPFIGIVPLNVADVMRSTISVKYGVDVITGACLAQVTVSRDNNSSVLYQYSGNCAVQYPISSGSYMGIVSSVISVAGGVAATVASGGAAAPLALGAAGGLLNAHTSVQHSGGFSGNAGAMGGKTPYLIITRPQTKVAFNAETMQGYPTNDYVTVGNCSGYVKADSVHVINAAATDEELTEISNLLLSGIII